MPFKFSTKKNLRDNLALRDAVIPKPAPEPEPVAVPVPEETPKDMSPRELDKFNMFLGGGFLCGHCGARHKERRTSRDCLKRALRLLVEDKGSIDIFTFKGDTVKVRTSYHIIDRGGDRDVEFHVEQDKSESYRYRANQQADPEHPISVFDALHGHKEIAEKYLLQYHNFGTIVVPIDKYYELLLFKNDNRRKATFMRISRKELRSVADTIVDLECRYPKEWAKARSTPLSDLNKAQDREDIIKQGGYGSYVYIDGCQMGTEQVFHAELNTNSVKTDFFYDKKGDTFYAIAFADKMVIISKHEDNEKIYLPKLVSLPISKEKIAEAIASSWELTEKMPKEA